MNKVYFGDCRESMRQLIADGVKVQTCVTSPPYWGLRDYGVDGQLGLEKTPDEYVANMVEVFSLVSELLNDDGTLWLNLGDTYSSHKDCKSIPQSMNLGGNRQDAHVIDKGKSNSRNTKLLKSVGLKNKDLIGIPWLVAFALRNDGWYLRSEIIWAKKNCMPESVKDRPTKSHEHIFLLSKSQKYYYDYESIMEDISEVTKTRYKTGWNGEQQRGYINGNQNNISAYMDPQNEKREKANKRDVWHVGTKPYPEAHFATYPPELIEPCILAGSRVDDIVLDPFFGSGTTGEVAQRLGRQWIGCELNTEYEAMQKNRTNQTAMIL